MQVLKHSCKKTCVAQRSGLRRLDLNSIQMHHRVHPMDLQLCNYDGVKRASPLLQHILLTAYARLHLYVQYLLQLNDMHEMNSVSLHLSYLLLLTHSNHSGYLINTALTALSKIDTTLQWCFS